MKKTLILTVLIGILLLGATALAGENWLAGDPAQVAAVILHTNDVHVAFQENIGYDGLALYKKELEAQYDHVLLIDAGDGMRTGAGLWLYLRQLLHLRRKTHIQSLAHT